MAEVVSLRSFAKTYRGGVVAVEDVSLEVRAGEVFGLLGPNGAGKTTTIHAILGLTVPSRGEVRVLGVDPLRDPLAVRSQTGVVLQRATLDPHLTGWENLQLYSELYPLDPRWRRTRILEVLEWAGLEDAAHRLVRTYSGGMRRRLDLAVSTLHLPRILLLDEPTLGLDVQSRRLLWSLIRELKEGGTTVLLTTHYLEEASKLCDRIAILSRGRVVELGTASELRNRVLGSAYRLTVKLGEAQSLEGVEFPVQPMVNGSELTFSGSPKALWEALAQLRERFGDDIVTFSYEEPSLDDVFVQLTEDKESSSGK